MTASSSPFPSGGGFLVRVAPRRSGIWPRSVSGMKTQGMAIIGQLTPHDIRVLSQATAQSGTWLTCLPIRTKTLAPLLMIKRDRFSRE